MLGKALTCIFYSHLRLRRTASSFLFSRWKLGEVQ